MSVEEEILNSSKTVAIVGVSAKEDRPSYIVGKYLKEHGYKVIPVNPTLKGKVLGEPVHPDLSSILQKVDVVDIFRKPDEVLPVVEEAIKIGAKAVWMQEGIVNVEAGKRAEAAGLKLVMGKCMRKEHIRLHEGHPLLPSLVKGDERGICEVAASSDSGELLATTHVVFSRQWQK